MGAELAELASGGATTFVGLVVTDAWQQAKERIGRLLARGGDSRLEAARLEVERTELVIADESGDGATTRRIQQDWEARLRDLLLRDPSAVAELCAVLDDFDPRREQSAQSVTVHNEIRGGRQGTVFQIGTVGSFSTDASAVPGPGTGTSPVA